LILDTEHMILGLLIAFYVVLTSVAVATGGSLGKVLYYLGAALLTLGVYIL